MPIPRALYRSWLATDVLRPVHAALGNALLRLADTALYDSATGLRVFNPEYRDSVSNLL